MTNLEGVEAVILAGGYGTRLRKVVADRPKVLAQVNGQPFIYILLDKLSEASIRRVLLCTGYMGDRVEEVVGNQYRSLRLDYSREDTPLGTGGALANAKNMLRGEMVLVINGDSFVDIDYRNFAAWHVMKNADISIAIRLCDIADRYGTIEIALDQRVTKFSERTNPRIDGPVYINVGVYLMRRSIIDALPSQDKLSLERQVIPSLIGNNMFGYKTCGKFIDIGTPESYQSVDAFFCRRNSAD